MDCIVDESVALGRPTSSGVGIRKKRANENVEMQKASTQKSTEKEKVMSVLDTALKKLETIDEWQLFGNFVASELRSIPRGQAVDLKRKLNSVIANYDYQPQVNSN